jgi:hypothetical protein
MKTTPISAIATSVSAQHQQLSLREIDDADGVEDHEQAQRHQCVDAAERQAVDDKLAHERISIRAR